MPDTYAFMGPSQKVNYALFILLFSTINPSLPLFKRVWQRYPPEDDNALSIDSYITLFKCLI